MTYGLRPGAPVYTASKIGKKTFLYELFDPGFMPCTKSDFDAAG
jgi:hypothetical protein